MSKAFLSFDICPKCYPKRDRVGARETKANCWPIARVVGEVDRELESRKANIIYMCTCPKSSFQDQSKNKAVKKSKAVESLNSKIGQDSIYDIYSEKYSEKINRDESKNKKYKVTKGLKMDDLKKLQSYLDNLDFDEDRESMQSDEEEKIPKRKREREEKMPIPSSLLNKIQDTSENVDMIVNSDKFKKEVEKHKFDRDIALTSGTLIPLPDIRKRETLYIGGCSGAGKSTYASNYIKEFKKLFPDRRVYVFSSVKSDFLIDNIGVSRVVLDEKILDPTTKIKVEDLANSLVLFDDIDVIPDEKIKKEVYALQGALLETGRHNDVYVVSTAHQIMNYKQTRTLLNEATAITFFPQSGSTYHIKRLLTLYCGLSKKEIDRIFSLASRWVTIYKQYPQYVIYSSGVYCL